MRQLQIWQAVGLLLFFNSYPLLAQGPEDEGPAPPPPAAPIDQWVPYVVLVTLIWVFFFLARKKKRLTLKTIIR
ncbi:hypothetical protein [Flavobacterium sp.]|jgi:hypothetical protein|uniref:hypothetical protein n=1 Tax=Flavobacterium sp. TaxID=239 RepID=UPI00391AB7EF